MNSRERSILLITCYGHFLSHFNMLVFPAILLPLTEFYQLSMSEVLSLAFWMYLLFGITAFPWGIAADKLGAKRLLTTFYLGAGLSALFGAFFIDKPGMLMIGLTGIGLFSGIYHPAGLGWISKEIEKTSRGMAYNGMFGNLGLAFAPLCAGTVNHLFGIKAVYFLVAFLNSTGLVFMFLARNNQEKSKSKTDAKKNGSLIPFLVLLVTMMLGGVVYRATSVTLPAYIELNSSSVHEFISTLFAGATSTNVNATILTSIIYFIGMGGQYFGGRVGEKFDLRRGYLTFHLITIPAALCMSVFTDVPLFLIALIHGFFLLGMQPIENTLVARLTPPAIRSSAYGLKFVFTFGMGAFGLKLVDWVKGEWSFSGVYVALAFASLVLCLFILLLMRVTAKTDLSS